MKNLSSLIYELADYALANSLIFELDYTYTVSRLMELFDVDEIDEKGDTPHPVRRISEILDDVTAIMGERGALDPESVTERDLYDTKIMGVLTPRPSEVIRKFKTLAAHDKRLATDYFYSLAVSSNYIRRDRIERDLKWQVASEYGDIDVTINLSKPEKDPKAIAAAKLLPQTGYPRCALCHENEGYRGTLSKPARQNLRQLPFEMDGEAWYLQYSPYVYYNEHCIALSAEHTPMKIDRSSFKKLLGFVTESSPTTSSARMPTLR